jgi:hypothetical protein
VQNFKAFIPFSNAALLASIDTRYIASAHSTQQAEIHSRLMVAVTPGWVAAREQWQYTHSILHTLS